MSTQVHSGVENDWHRIHAQCQYNADAFDQADIEEDDMELDDDLIENSAQFVFASPSRSPTHKKRRFANTKVSWSFTLPNKSNTSNYLTSNLSLQLSFYFLAVPVRVLDMPSSCIASTLTLGDKVSWSVDSSSLGMHLWIVLASWLTLEYRTTEKGTEINTGIIDNNHLTYLFCIVSVFVF